MNRPDRPLPHPVTGVSFPSPVPPGAGWPEDPATPVTAQARTPAQVRRLADDADLADLSARISVCRACARLVRWREETATTKRAAYDDQPYWGRPVPGWGAERPSILVVGLAPGAHGANRTGRNFTGDASSTWLFASLHRTGLAQHPTSAHAGDGQVLHGVRLVATVRCAPPQNKPTPTERDTCAPWIQQEVALLAPTARVVMALGAFGWDAALKALRGAGYDVPSPKPRFGHLTEVVVDGPAGPLVLLGCYHPSLHNTATGRLTAPMLDEAFTRARNLAGTMQP